MDKLKSSSIKLITFDAFGLLYTLKEPVEVQYAAVASRYGYNIPTHDLKTHFRQSFKNMSKEYPSYGKRQGLTVEDWWKKLTAESFSQFNISPADQANISTELCHRFDSKQGYDMADHATETLEALSKSPRRCLGIVSNSDLRVDSVLRSLGLRHYFHFVQLSYSLDLEKPDPRVFHAAMAKAKESLGNVTLLASECLHVGDDYEKDVIGARAAGWNALLVDHTGHHPNTDLTSLRPLSCLDTQKVSQ